MGVNIWVGEYASRLVGAAEEISKRGEEQLGVDQSSGQS